MTDEKMASSLQVRVSDGPRSLSPETYRAMQIAAIDAHKSIGQLLEQLWAEHVALKAEAQRA